MAEMKLLAVSGLVVFCLQIQGCSNSETGQQTSVFQKVPEIAEIKPQKPVKIKMKRNAKGDYSWELTGDDTDKVIEVDKRLKKSLVE